jgi:hypothetical protein
MQTDCSTSTNRPLLHPLQESRGLLSNVFSTAANAAEPDGMQQLLWKEKKKKRSRATFKQWL